MHAPSLALTWHYNVAQRRQHDEKDDASAMTTKTPARCWRQLLQTLTSADPVDEYKAGYDNNTATTMMSRKDASAMREMTCQHNAAENASAMLA
jgi:hypothetical protein